MNEIIINIEGMHCEGCSNRLEKVLNSKEEIISAKVSLEDKKAEIKYNGLTEKELIKIIETAGFKAKIK